MTSHSLAQPNDYPNIHTRVALVERAQASDHELILSIYRKIDKIMWGVIVLLLAVIGQLVFKH